VGNHPLRNTQLPKIRHMTQAQEKRKNLGAPVTFFESSQEREGKVLGSKVIMNYFCVLWVLVLTCLATCRSSWRGDCALEKLM